MAEYIDRKALIEHLEKDPLYDLVEQYGVTGVIESFPAADVQSVKWIPVTERLPNGNGEYLVSGKDKVWVCEFMILGDVGGWCNSAMNPCVKYWMPLPEPPKDGET